MPGDGDESYDEEDTSYDIDTDKTYADDQEDWQNGFRDTSGLDMSPDQGLLSPPGPAMEESSQVQSSSISTKKIIKAFEYNIKTTLKICTFSFITYNIKSNEVYNYPSVSLCFYIRNSFASSNNIVKQ